MLLRVLVFSLIGDFGSVIDVSQYLPGLVVSVMVQQLIKGILAGDEMGRGSIQPVAPSSCSLLGGQHFAAALLHLATLCSRHCHTSTGPSAQPHFAVHLP